MTAPIAFSRLAVVNRGEAAMRGLRGVADYNRRHGTAITGIAMVTDPDARTWFARRADEVVSLGPAFHVADDGTRKLAYLDQGLVMDGLRRAGADAVWVGWGFLAEDANFAQACEEAGIVFVGPRAEVIRRLGDKIAAKRLAESVDVPVTPWSGGPVTDVDEALAAAERIGYPVMVKSAAGGGGRGIRRVTEAAALPAALASARAESKLAFSDDRVFLEQAVVSARHLEVQAICDGQGGAWAVGVRDCSVQRRNQKVIEESASAALLDPDVEQQLRDDAVRLCLQAEYRGAGTVEFLYHEASGVRAFMEVNTRLQVEHPVTELVTGIDLVGLQLHVARGLPLEGDVPPSVGHAVEVRLNAEDPARGFAPSPGRVAELRLPGGPGVRVDTGITEGDRIAAEFDSMIAKILTWGEDRPEALARLERALQETSVIVEQGTSNASFLLALLRNADVRRGGVDTGWLDRLTAVDGHQAEPDPLAVLAAAIELADDEADTDVVAFLASGVRGRPEVREESGWTLPLRYRGEVHELTVYRTGLHSYRVAHPDGMVVVTADRLGAHERRLHLGRRTHRIVVSVHGPTVLVEVDGVAHRVERDDGGTVRSPAPAVVIRHLVAVGAEVEPGQPLVLIESMKMETTVAAPSEGRVRELLAPLNTQVEAGAPLLVMEPLRDEEGEGAGRQVAGTHRPLPTTAPPGVDLDARCESLFTSLRAYVLGYDLDPASVDGLQDERAAVCAGLGPGHPALSAHEEEILGIFADLGVLSSRMMDEEVDDGFGVVRSAREHLVAYLRAIDLAEEVVPASFRAHLSRALAHYGVESSQRSPELEWALHRCYTALQRLDRVAPIVAGILQHRLDDSTAGEAPPQLEELLDRLIGATEGRHQVVCDLARTLRFRLFDAPPLERVRQRLYQEMEGVLDRLAEPLDAEEREALLTRLVRSPQPMRAPLLHRYRSGPDQLRRVALEVRMRRYYRTRDLSGMEIVDIDGQPLARASYDLDGRDVRLYVAYAEQQDAPTLLRSVAAHTADLPADSWLVIDLMMLREGGPDSLEELSRQVSELVADIAFPHVVHRLDVTATYLGDDGDDVVSRYVTHRQHDDGRWVEDVLYRDLHPMLAKRVGVWRLSNFDITRLPSVEDVYLFHGIARENPDDERLFAIAEVRDLTAVEQDGRIVALPQLARMLAQALAGIRVFQSGRSPRQRLLHNRVIIYVRPTWTVPEEVWRDLAHDLAPATAGLGIEKVVLVVRIPDETTGEPVPTVLHLHHVASHGVVIRRAPATDRPIRPLSGYEQRVLKTQRRGSTYPYELLRMLTPPDDAQSDFPPGEFLEMDLDDDGHLVGVSRPWGHNTANIVVGVLSNRTETVPEGMRRVVVLGDPSRSLGSLAEAECRRIIAALDLAEAERLPLEWYAVSSGARISMESGTENMDWIGAVLRRLVQFTQAGGEVNIVVTGINVGAQPYWNAEATMLMHTRGVLIMTPASAMVLTGKQALDFSGGVSAEDNLGIGGYERIMGPNGQGQYWAPTLEAACALLLRHYAHTYVVPGERFPRTAATGDPDDRDVCAHAHTPTPGSPFATVGEIFSLTHNPERKQPFDMRSVMRAVMDSDHEPLERWRAWRHADNAIVWDARIGGMPVLLLGIESHPVRRQGLVPADGPPVWTSGTLFPQASRKIARALNAASGNRPAVIMANLSGFDGSPESLREWQLEYGAEIGRAVTNFDGPIVFVVVSRYHGGAFVVFSKRLNPGMEIAAVEGAYASVIGGTPAAATVFAREVSARTHADPRVAKLREATQGAQGQEAVRMHAELERVIEEVRAEKIGEIAETFDTVHDISRAQRVGSVDHIIPAERIRPYVIDAVRRGVSALGAAADDVSALGAAADETAGVQPSTSG